MKAHDRDDRLSQNRPKDNEPPTKKQKTNIFVTDTDDNKDGGSIYRNDNDSDHDVVNNIVVSTIQLPNNQHQQQQFVQQHPQNQQELNSSSLLQQITLDNVQNITINSNPKINNNNNNLKLTLNPILQKGLNATKDVVKRRIKLLKNFNLYKECSNLTNLDNYNEGNLKKFAFFPKIANQRHQIAHPVVQELLQKELLNQHIIHQQNMIEIVCKHIIIALNHCTDDLKSIQTKSIELFRSYCDQHRNHTHLNHVGAQYSTYDENTNTFHIDSSFENIIIEQGRQNIVDHLSNEYGNNYQENQINLFFQLISDYNNKLCDHNHKLFLSDNDILNDLYLEDIHSSNKSKLNNNKNKKNKKNNNNNNKFNKFNRKNNKNHHYNKNYDENKPLNACLKK